MAWRSRSAAAEGVPPLVDDILGTRREDGLSWRALRVDSVGTALADLLDKWRRGREGLVGEISAARFTSPGWSGRASTAAPVDGMVEASRRLRRETLASREEAEAEVEVEVEGEGGAGEAEDELKGSMCSGREVICNNNWNLASLH
jgi:hypothetical protein